MEMTIPDSVFSRSCFRPVLVSVQAGLSLESLLSTFTLDEVSASSSR